MRVLPLVLAIASLTLIAGCAKKGGEEAGEGLPAVATPEEALAQLPEKYRTADLENGKAKFGFCRSCHTVTEGGPNGVGPNLYRVFGRKAGTKADYKYSDAVKNAGFVWDAEHLEGWLSKPKDYLPGTKMTFVGLPEQKDRDDLIAYLKVETGTIKPAK
jgi:cytochrome c